MSTQSIAHDTRPIDLRTGKPIGPLVQPGYHPGYRTLSQQKFWDAKTREVVLDRVNNVPPIRFFSREEARLLEAVCDCVLPQDDRDESQKIPIVPQIDKRLFHDSDTVGEVRRQERVGQSASGVFSLAGSPLASSRLVGH